MTPLLEHDVYVFDLDHTLYDATKGIFDVMHDRMSDYVAKIYDVERDEADRIRTELYKGHGTTLHGLLAHKQIDADAYLDYVHDIDISHLETCLDTIEAIKALPGRKIVYTNAPIKHADNILGHIGMADLFEGVFDLYAADLVPKPDENAFKTFIKRYDLDGQKIIMFEDTSKNLVTADKLGFSTVWLSHGREVDDRHAAHIHHTTTNLKEILIG